MDTITLAEVNKLMYTGEPFDITYITCDFTRNTGGKTKEYQAARLHLSNDTDSKKKSVQAKKIKKSTIKVNIILQSGDIRSIYKILITQFNGKQVLI